MLKSQLIVRALAAFVLMANSNAGVAEGTLNLFARHDATAQYVESVLRLAIRQSGNLIDLNIENVRVNAPQWRDALESGQLDVIWSVSTPDLERRFKRIPIDIYYGYMGLRVCVSNTEQSAKLKTVNSSDDLKGITFGSGIGWSDTMKFQSAGLNVIQDDLDRLVDKARDGIIDCFARGIFEPWDEHMKYLQRGITNLVINDTFAVRYPNPFYLYVNRNDGKTFKLLSEGLAKAVEDGSLEKTFKESRQYSQFDRYALIEQRIIIDLPYTNQ